MTLFQITPNFTKNYLMKNEEHWKPSRVIFEKGEYKINSNYYSVGSLYIGETILPAYAKAMQKYLKGDMLDCGSGHAPYYIIYKEVVKSVTCIDWDVTDERHDYLDYKMDLNKPLTFSGQQFDSILLADVLEHIYEPKLLLKELANVLRPDGNLVVFVPFYYWIHSEPHDYHRYTEFSLRQMCEDSGLKVTHLKPYGGYFDIGFDLINKFFIKRRFSLKVLLKFSKWIKGTGYYKKREAVRLESFPLGYVLVATKISSRE